MSDPRQTSKISLEDLLRLKRAERPSPEFWVSFERELRQKQLTALVEKRRWWHGWSGAFGRRAYLYLPAGATAVMAFAFVAGRFHGPVGVAQTEETASQVAVADATIETLPATIVASTESRHEEPVHVAAAPALHVERALPATTRVIARSEQISPSARSIAANLEHLEQSEPELVHAVMGNRLSSSARVQRAVASAEVEHEEANEGGSRYRLIARYAERALTPEPAAPSLVRDRLARRLADDLGDGMSRIGVGGDRVSLKF